jgi:hypothetical protein
MINYGTGVLMKGNLWTGKPEGYKAKIAGTVLSWAILLGIADSTKMAVLWLG